MKKSLLAGCIALASAGTQAELSPMSEFELHNVTGQAGVDIELDVGVQIGEIRYTDTEEVVGGVSDGDGGSLTISDVYIGGGENRSTLFGFSNPGNTANLNNLRFKIDIDQDGSLLVLGEPTSGGVGVVDILLTTGEIAVEGAGGINRHVLVDSISMYGGALALEMRVDGATNDIELYTAIGIEDLDIDMSSSFGIVIEDAVVAGNAYNEKLAANRTPDASDRVAKLYVNMSTDVADGVKFDFASPFDDENVIDIRMPSVSVGGSQLGGIVIDDLQFRGVSMVVSCH